MFLENLKERYASYVCHTCFESGHISRWCSAKKNHDSVKEERAVWKEHQLRSYGKKISGNVGGVKSGERVKGVRGAY